MVVYACRLNYDIQIVEDGEKEKRDNDRPSVSMDVDVFLVEALVVDKECDCVSEASNLEENVVYGDSSTIINEFIHLI